MKAPHVTAHGPPGGSQPSARKPYLKTVAVNRRARHDYHIDEVVEAGIALHGSEVKSLRTSQVDFKDSYARVADGECWLIGLRLATYEKSYVQVPPQTRPRRLLLHKRQVLKLQVRSEREGCTLIPLEIYFSGRWAKVKLGVARGKAEHDKRRTILEHETRRDIDRALKNARRR